MGNKHTMTDLYQMQSLPLSAKTQMTARRITEWVDRFGEEGVYVSFSGGKDSTVLVDIVRNVCKYKDIPLVFVDVPTQYPELKKFAQTFQNLIVLKPKISFSQVCEKYGFPLISKEVSNCVSGARKYLKYLDNKKNANTILTDRQTDRQTDRLALTEQSISHNREKLQTVSRQDMTAEYQTCGQTETLLLSNQATQIEKQIDIATTLMARDYKGFGNQPMNGVIEWKN